MESKRNPETGIKEQTRKHEKDCGRKIGRMRPADRVAKQWRKQVVPQGNLDEIGGKGDVQKAEVEGKGQRRSDGSSEVGKE